MRSSKILSLAAFLGIAAIISTAFITDKREKKISPNDKGFAVVELYTSEGCSSCPPADALISKIEKESNGKPVYILAYHVDYWNRLGWKDQFSSADFSKRQNEYAGYLNLSSVYTPQIVVNGKTEFVGSEEGTLRNTLRTSLQKTQVAQLNLSVTIADQKQASLKFNTLAADKNTVLQIAVLEKAAVSKVASGENGGRTLSHVQIVRKLQQVNLTGDSGTASIALPRGFDAHSWEIIGFLQSTVNGAISAASRAIVANDATVSSITKNSK